MCYIYYEVNLKVFSSTNPNFRHQTPEVGSKKNKYMIIWRIVGLKAILFI